MHLKPQPDESDGPTSKQGEERRGCRLPLLRPTARAIRARHGIPADTTSTPNPCHFTRPHTTATSVVSTNREDEAVLAAPQPLPVRPCHPASRVPSHHQFSIREMLPTGFHIRPILYGLPSIVQLQVPAWCYGEVPIPPPFRLVRNTWAAAAANHWRARGPSAKGRRRKRKPVD